jgi:RNA polymerase sigma-70 factor (family 1)
MDSNTIDLIIFHSVKRGDLSAFEILFTKYYSQLCFYSFKYTNRDDVAEEIVSDVFHILWEKKESIDIKISIKAYLYTITKNNSINYLNKKKQPLDFNVGDKVLTNLTDSIHLSSTTIDKNDDFFMMSAKLNKLLAELPPQRKKILLLYREGFTPKEIAENLHLSEKTIRNTLGRTITYLKKAANS